MVVYLASSKKSQHIIYVPCTLLLFIQIVDFHSLSNFPISVAVDTAFHHVIVAPTRGRIPDKLKTCVSDSHIDW